MKRIGFVILLMVLTLGVNAQTRWGIKAGGNLSELTLKYDGNKDDNTKPRFGFHAGFMMEYSFTPEFAIQPELLFSMNGSGYKVNVAGVETKTNTTIYQLQLPVNLKYKIGNEDLGFFVTAGPYIGYGLSAKAKTDGISSSVDLYDNAMNRFDFGIGVGLGVELSRFIVGVGYQFGIVNLSDVDKTTNRLGTFQLSVGYFF